MIRYSSKFRPSISILAVRNNTVPILLQSISDHHHVVRLEAEGTFTAFSPRGRILFGSESIPVRLFRSTPFRERRQVWGTFLPLPSSTRSILKMYRYARTRARAHTHTQTHTQTHTHTHTHTQAHTHKHTHTCQGLLTPKHNN